MAASPVTFSAPGAAATGGAPASKQPAKLLVHQPPKSGSAAQPGPQMFTIDFQFNPRELSLSKNAKWAREPQRNAAKSGPPEFTGADPCKLTLEMFIDATDTMGDRVVKTVEQLFSCCVATPESRRDTKGSPPWVIFQWGGMMGFPAYVASVTAKYTLFTPAGMPVRAVCTVNLEEISGELGGQNPTSGALTASDTHVVIEGDTLPSLSYQAYGDAAAWRVIAEANGIDDPMCLRAGTVLRVPSREEVPVGGQ